MFLNNLSGQSQDSNKVCDKYISSCHKNEVLEVLRASQTDKHYSIDINFVVLFEYDPHLGGALLRDDPETVLRQWDDSLLRVQSAVIQEFEEKNLVLKPLVHCRIHGLPLCPELHKNVFPRNDEANKFLQVSGTVVRMTAIKMLEYQRNYICTKCKYAMLVKAEYEKKYNIALPKKCTNPEGCNGTNIVSCGELDPDLCKDYQEIKMQESMTRIDTGSMPSSMWVTLEDDLVDCCKPGDNVTVCGIVKRRWHTVALFKKMDIELVLKANHIQVNNTNSSPALVTPEIKSMFEGFWETYARSPLAARDIILKSVCPQIFGLYLVKLAIAVVLAGGSHIQDSSGTGVNFRSEPHLLLVGDPGTGKSQLLRFASKIIPRSVLTTGVGSTAAGLTVTAVMEDGEWQLEGGALVLSDGGICCIDEFNSMKEHDRTSIHEAMEQQTISVAKASIVCKLSTKCSILAATNPKGNIDPAQPLNMNVALASPLLSRFDLILLLRDTVNERWDTFVCDYILDNPNDCSKLTDSIFWTVETLQAYFAVIKKSNPQLTPESNRILGNYYQAQRRKDIRNKARTTVRLLDSLVRLSQGHARLMYHKKVETMDAVMAVALIETAMMSETSMFDLSFEVQSDFPDCPTTSYRDLAETILRRLELDDLLQEEIARINDTMSFNKVAPTIRPDVKIRSPNDGTTTVESKYFPVATRNNEQSNGSEENKGSAADKSDGKDEPESKHDTESNGKSNKRKKLAKNSDSENNESRKKPKNRNENDVVDDLAVLRLMPSVNDDLPSILQGYEDEEYNAANTDNENPDAEQADSEESVPGEGLEGNYPVINYEENSQNAVVRGDGNFDRNAEETNDSTVRQGLHRNECPNTTEYFIVKEDSSLKIIDADDLIGKNLDGNLAINNGAGTRDSINHGNNRVQTKPENIKCKRLLNKFRFRPQEKNVPNSSNSLGEEDKSSCDNSRFENLLGLTIFESQHEEVDKLDLDI